MSESMIPDIPGPNDIPQAAPRAPVSQESVNVINPSGDLVSLPADKAHIAVSTPGSGYKAATPEDLHAYKNEQTYGGTGQQILAGAEGVAQGVLGPLAPALEIGSGLTTGKDILGREETHPGTHYVGQGAGLVGSAFIPGFGEARVAAEAADAAKLTAKVTQAAVKSGTMSAEVAAPKLAAAAEAIQAGKTAINPLSYQSVLSGTAEKLAAKAGIKAGDTVASNAAAGAFKLAIESGTLQMGDEISHMIEGDPRQTLESAAVDVGAAALLGAPLGGIFGAAAPLWHATAGKAFGEVAQDFKGRMKFNVHNPDPVAAMTEELSSHLKASDSVFDEVYGATGLKAEAINQLLPKEVTPNIIGQSSETIEAAKSFLEDMRKNPDLYPRNLAARFERDFNILREKTMNAESSQELFGSLQEFKQNLQSYSKNFVPHTDPAHDFIQGAQSIAKELKVGLEDPEVWGKAGAVQKELNEAASQYQFQKFSPRKQFESKFMSNLGPDKVIDPAKIQSYLKQTGNAGQKLRQEMLGNFLEADAKYRSAVDSTYAKMGQPSPFPESSLTFTNQTLNKQTAGMKLADYVYQKGLSQVAGEGLGAGLGATAGAAFGHPIFGAYLGERALGHFFSSVLPTLIKPLYHGTPSAEGLKSAMDFGMAAVRGQKLIDKTTKSIFKAGAEVLPTSLVPTSKDREKLSKALEKAQTSPETLLQNTGALGHYAPQHAAEQGMFTSTALSHLQSLKPPTIQRAPLDAKQEPNAIQKAKYERTLNIVQQPLIVLNHLKSGELLPSDVVTMKTVYPALYEKVAKNLTSELVDHLSEGHAIPYHTRMSLSLFLGQPLDSTLTPQGISSHQNLSNSTPMQQQGTPQGSPKALGKMSKMSMTAGQAAEAKAMQ